MQLPRIVLQMMLLPFLAVMLPLVYAIAWLREAMDDAARAPVRVVVRQSPPRLPRR